MFDNVAQHSSIISITNVTYDFANGNTGDPTKDSETCTLTVRVLNDIKWKKIIQQLLMASVEAEDFGVVVKQEFYVNEDQKPAFVWSLSLWGDLEVASTYVLPILNKRGAPPPPPPSLGVSAPARPSVVPDRQYKSDSGSVYTEVALPFKRNQSEKSDEAINARSPRSGNKPRAFVEGVK